MADDSQIPEEIFASVVRLELGERAATLINDRLRTCYPSFTEWQRTQLAQALTKYVLKMDLQADSLDELEARVRAFAATALRIIMGPPPAARELN